MKGKIILFDVNDADAILVHLNKAGKDLIMVIDGGNPRAFNSTVKRKLEKLLQETNKDAPDIVVATHFDQDHIGGLEPLLREYIQNIKEVWVHRPPEFYDSGKQMIKSFNKENNSTKSFQSYSLEDQIINQYPNVEKEAIRDKVPFVIKTLQQLRDLLKIVPEDKIREVFNGYSFRGWPEIKVLGPSKEYYSTLFPPKISLEKLIISETVDYLNESSIVRNKRNLEMLRNGVNPCELLKTDETADLTPTNKASIIIAIDNKEKRHLFTGDAGIESFKMIPKYQSELKNLYWLKVPHHGSENNLSKEIIDIMKPMYSDNSGKRHEDQIVLDCISQNTRSQGAVRSTKSSGDLEFLIG